MPHSAVSGPTWKAWESSQPVTTERSTCLRGLGRRRFVRPTTAVSLPPVTRSRRCSLGRFRALAGCPQDAVGACEAQRRVDLLNGAAQRAVRGNTPLASLSAAATVAAARSPSLSSWATAVCVFCCASVAAWACAGLRQVGRGISRRHPLLRSPQVPGVAANRSGDLGQWCLALRDARAQCRMKRLLLVGGGHHFTRPPNESTPQTGTWRPPGHPSLSRPQPRGGGLQRVRIARRHLDAVTG
jgi:hypothetical protein